VRFEKVKVAGAASHAEVWAATMGDEPGGLPADQSAAATLVWLVGCFAIALGSTYLGLGYWLKNPR
jgi:hypothetical protein